MPEISWEDVIRRRDELIGGDSESVEDGVPYRGPIKDIRKERNLLHIDLEWCARMDRQTGEWELWHISSSSVNMDIVRPYDIGEGRIHFMLPMLGGETLFPKGGSRLDPSKVRGLEVAAT